MCYKPMNIKVENTKLMKVEVENTKHWMRFNEPDQCLTCYQFYVYVFMRTVHMQISSGSFF